MYTSDLWRPLTHRLVQVTNYTKNNQRDDRDNIQYQPIIHYGRLTWKSMGRYLNIEPIDFWVRLVNLR